MSRRHLNRLTSNSRLPAFESIAALTSFRSTSSGPANVSRTYLSSLYSSSLLYACLYRLKIVLAVVSTPTTALKSRAPGVPMRWMSSGSSPGHRSGKSAAETMDKASESCAWTSRGAPSMSPTSIARTCSFSPAATE